MPREAMASTDASIAEKGSVKNAAMAVLRIVTIFWALVNAYKIPCTQSRCTGA